MKTILLLYQAVHGNWGSSLKGKYWLDAQPPYPLNGHYFREGHDTLFDSSPTWFDSAEAAVAAAEAQGFMVLNADSPTIC